MIGGVGREGVRYFYTNHLVGKFFPPDVIMTNVSRTIGHNQIVDELVISFTHTVEIDWMLPGIQPTGKRVEIPLVAIVKFRGDKLHNEHIYWDQASVLVQIGLLDPAGFPIAGIEATHKLLDAQLPSNQLMGKWTETGNG